MKEKSINLSSLRTFSFQFSCDSFKHKLSIQCNQKLQPQPMQEIISKVNIVMKQIEPLLRGGTLQLGSENNLMNESYEIMKWFQSSYGYVIFHRSQQHR